jgi:hypothetical protein
MTVIRSISARYWARTKEVGKAPPSSPVSSLDIYMYITVFRRFFQWPLGHIAQSLPVSDLDICQGVFLFNSGLPRHVYTFPSSFECSTSRNAASYQNIGYKAQDTAGNITNGPAPRESYRLCKQRLNRSIRWFPRAICEPYRFSVIAEAAAWEWEMLGLCVMIWAYVNYWRATAPALGNA